jgi:ribosomal protein L29
MKRRENLTELRGLSVADLVGAITKAEHTLLDLRFAVSFRKLKSTSDVAKSRKQIARLQTILREKLATEPARANH